MVIHGFTVILYFISGYAITCMYMCINRLEFQRYTNKDVVTATLLSFWDEEFC